MDDIQKWVSDNVVCVLDVSRLSTGGGDRLLYKVKVLYKDKELSYQATLALINRMQTILSEEETISELEDRRSKRL